MVCLTPLKIGPSALGQILQCLSAHRTMRESSLGIGMGVPDLFGDGGIQRQMLSPGSLRGWGSSGKIAGAGMERWWREMDHSV